MSTLRRMSSAGFSRPGDGVPAAGARRRAALAASRVRVWALGLTLLFVAWAVMVPAALARVNPLLAGSTVVAVILAGFAAAAAPRLPVMLSLLGGYTATVVAVSVVVGGGEAVWTAAGVWLLFAACAAFAVTRWGRFDPVWPLAGVLVALLGVYTGTAMVGPSWVTMLWAGTGMVCAVSVVLAVPWMRWWGFAVVNALSGGAGTTRTEKQSTQSVNATPVTDVSVPLPLRRAAQRRTAQLLDTLPGEFHVLHAAHVDTDIAPVAHLVFGPQGMFVLGVTVLPDAATAADTLRLEGLGVDVGQEIAELSLQRGAVARRLGVDESDVMAVWVLLTEADLHAAQEDALTTGRATFAGRPAGHTSDGVRVRVTALGSLREVLVDPLIGTRKVAGAAAAAKAAVRLRPVRPHHGEPAPVTAFQVGVVDADGHVEWRPWVPHTGPSHFAWKTGQTVSVLTPYGPVKGFRLVEVPQRVHGFAMAKVCSEQDWPAVQAHLGGEITTVPAQALLPAPVQVSR